jgi:integrase
MSIYIPKIAKDFSFNGTKKYENIQIRADGKYRVHVRWTRQNGERYEKDKIFSRLAEARSFRDATYDDFNRLESGISIHEHAWVRDTGTTVAQVYSEIIKSEWSRKDKSQKQYAQLINDYVLPKIGNLPMKKTSVGDLKRLIKEFFFSEIRAQRSAEIPRSVYPSVALAQRLKIALSQFFQFAVENEIIERNPVREVKIRWTKLSEDRARDKVGNEDPEERYAHHKYLSKSIRAELLESARATPAYPPLLLMDRLGLRPREALALRKVDFLISEGSVRISQQYIGGGKFSPTKTRKDRTIPIPKSLLDWVKSLQIAEDEPICQNSEGGFLDERRFRRVFHVARELAASKNVDFPTEVTPYWLRHSWCSRMLNEVKESPVIVAAVSGHDVKVLLDYYAHPDDSAKRRMMDASEEFNA